MNVRLDEFSVEEASIAEVGRRLSRSFRIGICVEERPSAMLTLQLHNVTIEDVLNEITRQMPQYTWNHDAVANLINIFSKSDAPLTIESESIDSDSDDKSIKEAFETIEPAEPRGHSSGPDRTLPDVSAGEPGEAGKRVAQQLTPTPHQHLDVERRVTRQYVKGKHYSKYFRMKMESVKHPLLYIGAFEASSKTKIEKKKGKIPTELIVLVVLVAIGITLIVGADIIFGGSPATENFAADGQTADPDTAASGESIRDKNSFTTTQPVKSENLSKGFHILWKAPKPIPKKRMSSYERDKRGKEEKKKRLEKIVLWDEISPPPETDSEEGE